MKKILILAVSGLLIGLSCSKKSSPAPPPPPPPVPDVHLTKGLLVYLPFSGNIADSSGNGNTTTALNGATLTSDRNGNANSAFGGTGAGQRVLVTSNGSIKFDTAFSFSFDLILNAITRYGFVNFVDNTNALSYVGGSGTYPSSPYDLDFSTANDTYTCSSNTSPSNIGANVSSFVPQAGVWYNIINIYHKGALATYVNGQAISTNTGGATSLNLCPNAKLIVGGWWDADPQSINGKMDNVRLYNRVLTTDEIAALSKGF